MSDVIQIDTPRGVWKIAQCQAKLRTRGALPGAFAWDRTAHALRDMVMGTDDALAALPMVFASSWLVNNRTPSPVFKKWLCAPLREAWRSLLDLTDDVGSRQWPQRSAASRDAVRDAVTAICVDGQGVAAVSKVLALLRPDLVPLMDDAAIAFALGAVEPPERADRPLAGAEHFVPMLDHFAAAVAAQREPLAALAEQCTPSGSSPEQILDRLLWFETWGYRLFGSGRGSWWKITGNDASAQPVIVALGDSPSPGAKPSEIQPLSSFTNPELAARAAALIAV